MCYGYAEAIDFQLHVEESCIIGDIYDSGYCIGDKLRVHYGYPRQKGVLHYGCDVALLGLKRGTNRTKKYASLVVEDSRKSLKCRHFAEPNHWVTGSYNSELSIFTDTFVGISSRLPCFLTFPKPTA